MKLSEAQKRVLAQMPPNKWMSAYELGASRSTLDALYEKGIIKRRGAGSPGAMLLPRVAIEYLRLE